MSDRPPCARAEAVGQRGPGSEPVQKSLKQQLNEAYRAEILAIVEVLSPMLRRRE